MMPRPPFPSSLSHPVHLKYLSPPKAQKRPPIDNPGESGAARRSSFLPPTAGRDLSEAGAWRGAVPPTPPAMSFVVEVLLLYAGLVTFALLHLLAQRSREEQSMASNSARVEAEIAGLQAEVQAQWAKAEGIKRQAENQAAMSERLLYENQSLKEQLRDLDRRSENLSFKKDD